MAKLSLRHIYKVYSNGCKAVSDFNMEIDDKEFIVFVGPSGCGKSTTLRMIAGLEEISAGELYIDDVLVNDMEPKDRDISMVFQNYALYPHMTVYDNMAFGLKLRHVPQEEIHKKVLWAADVLKLNDYLDRKPRAMSGGQRQRVALGRAILRNPKVFLLDEPLSNLDAKLRTEMRAEITKLHQTIGTTFIYVTHDQVEAMTLGTRVVVMKLGFVQQIDTPQNLYNYPCNKFVAGFIGTPQMNFFDVKLLRKNDNVHVNFDQCDTEFDVDFNNLIKVRPSYLKGDKTVTLGIRCENISIDPEVVSKSKNVTKVKVSHFEELGSETLVYGDIDMNGDGFTTKTTVIIKDYKKTRIVPGQIIDAAFDLSKAHFFDSETEESIAPRVPNENVFDCEVSKGVLSFLDQKIELPSAMKCEDVKDAELFVPTDAINFDGEIAAKVVNVEEVNGQQVIHVETNKRIFFIKSDKQVKVGDKLKLGFDLTRLCVKKNDEDVIKSLQTRNVFVGAYTNPQNDKKAVKTIEKYYKDNADKEVAELTHLKNVEIGKLGLNNILIDEYKKEFLKIKNDAEAERSLQIGTLDLGKDGKKKVNQECKDKIAAAKADYEKKVLEFKELKANVKESEELRAEADAIANKYDEQIAAIVALYKEREAEYNAGAATNGALFAEVVNEDKEILANVIKELDEAHDAELDKYAQMINEAAEDKEKVQALKNEVRKINEKYELDKNVAITNSKTFLININGYYVKSSPLITKKIIQALGIGIFNVNYRFELGIKSVRIADQGFEAVVEEILDYGKEKFVLLSAHQNKIVVVMEKEVHKGDVVKLDFDLSDIHVYENRLDIRLY